MPNSETFFATTGSKFCQKLKTLKKLPKAFKIVPKWRNFAKSGHTGKLSKEGGEKERLA